MSLHTNSHSPRTTLSGRIQIGHKSGYYLFYSSVNIKPPRQRFGLCLGLAILYIEHNNLEFWTVVGCIFLYSQEMEWLESRGLRRPIRTN